MTQPLTMERFDEAFVPTGLPTLDSCIVARKDVAEHLELGVTGLLTVVQAPVGAGKTTSVASWASGVSQARGLVWLSLDGNSARPRIFLTRLVEALGQAGVRGLPRIAGVGELSPARRRLLLAAVADALRDSGPWVVVLDDFPTGTSGPIGADLEFLMGSTDHALRIVLLASAEPAMDLHRLRLAGEVATITTAELDLDRDEIAQMLRARGVVASAQVVTDVQRHTHGWAAGVQLAAVALVDQPSAEAMPNVARTIEDFVIHEVIESMPPDGCDLVMRGSVVEVVTRDLAQAIMPADYELASQRAAHSSAFVRLESDGTVRMHSLLRSVANARLRVRTPELARDAYRASAQWYADQGDIKTAIELASQASDWSWVARSLVDSFAALQILDGTLQVDSVAANVLDCEPLLAAAVSLRQGLLDQAEAALLRTPSSADLLTAQVSRSFMELDLARRTGDVRTGLERVAALRSLIATLPIARNADAAQLSRRLDASAGVLELLDGRIHQAAITLHRALINAKPGDVVRRDGLGHHALVEAMRGNLDQACREAEDCLVAAARFGGDAGAAAALLALGWVHAERAESAGARQRLQILEVQRLSEQSLVAVLRRILETRISIADGHPESAVRLIGSLQRCDEMPAPGWLADLVTVQHARALIAVGEPRQALAAVTPEPTSAAVEGRIVAAHARLEIGDLRGARALVSAVRSDLEQSALSVQVEAWVYEAQLSFEAGQTDRARQLVDRILRVAGAERMRAPLAACAGWLRSFAGRDQTLMRKHRDFLATLPGAKSAAVSGIPSEAVVPRPDEQVVEPLTERECQVLELLAMMCSTDEIATELFVSGNTVKTHVKGIFRKLGVNRRVDAVRAGRGLGLC